MDHCFLGGESNEPLLRNFGILFFAKEKTKSENKNTDTGIRIHNFRT